jgi:AraC-like DNA-binding protein
MSDFASAAMMRVLVQGMRELGLAVEPHPPSSSEARVELDAKRALVASALRQRGVACLPLLGRGLHRLSHDPTHLALVSATGALDLFQRWQRLERYIHSRHRCQLLDASDGQARLRHLAISGAASPLPVEDLVVVGVLAALLEAVGLDAVEVRIGSTLAYPDPDEAALEAAVRSGTTALWDFRWQEPKHRRIAADARAPRPAGLDADPEWPDLGRRVFLRLIEALTHPPTLPSLAQGLDLPPRTLQRELGRAGLSYSHLLAEARCRSGVWRLLHTDASIAEVGFLSGFSDQPHFTRELQRRVGMTPAAYRSAFAIPETTRSHPRS